MSGPQRLADDFMSEFSAYLDDRGAWSRRVEAEMRDGVTSAAEEITAQESDLVEAKRRLMSEWGTPRQLADEFNQLLSVTRAARLAGRILLATPVLAVGWALVVLLSPDPWPSEPPFVFVAARLLAVSVGIALICSTFILAGRRHATLRQRVPVSAATAASLGLGAANLVLLSMLIYRASAGPHAVSWSLALLPSLLTPMLLAVTVRDACRIARRRRRARLPG